MRISTSLLLLAIALIAAPFPLPAAERQTVHFTGTVTDTNGKPLEGATVQINNTVGIKILERSSDGKPDYFSMQLTGMSDSTGKYDVPLIFEPVGQPQATCRLWFERKGYVREYRTIHFPPVSQTNGPMVVALKEGMVLSGNIQLALHPLQRLNSRSNLPRHPELLKVESKSYTEHFLTDTNGNFEVYVPPGEYRLTAGAGNKPVVVDGIKAGTKNLSLRSPEFVWSEATIGKVFDDLWNTMDNQYSYFFLKADVDWNKLKTEYRSKASQAKNAKELAEALQPMLAKLDDLHIWIDYPGGRLGTKISTWNYNGNGNAVRSVIESPTICGKYAAIGRTRPDGFGYFLMINQSAATPELVKQAVEAIQKLRDVPGFIVDLRRANGGSEPLAEEIAKLFCAKPTVYAKSKYRNGPKHTDFGAVNERIMEPSANPYTKPVVCILGPGAVSSGEGFAKMMMALPNVTTVGLPTRGASGNPKPWPLGETDAVVTFSRWVDMMPDGQTFEGRGIPPDIRVDVPQSTYADRDPTLEKALEVLRKKIAEAK